MDEQRTRDEDTQSNSEGSRKRRSPSPSVEQPEVTLSCSAEDHRGREEEEVAYEESEPPAKRPPSYHDNRKSPPTSSYDRAAAAHAFPATPASNSDLAVRRKSSSSSVKRLPVATPNPVFSTPSSTPGSKAQRGLRHFSILVCKHVEQMGTTTYNQVADELVKQAISDRDPDGPKGKFDEKNIRRRVYDA